MPVRTLNSVADFFRAIESSSHSVVQFATYRGSSCKTQASSYRALAERYPSIDFFVVDALAHPAVLAEAEVSRLPPAGTPLFLFYEAAEGCVDAVVGEDGSDLGRTLKLFNPGPGTEPSSPLSSRSPAESWMFPASPVVGMNVRWGAEEDWEGSGFVAFA